MSNIQNNGTNSSAIDSVSKFIQRIEAFIKSNNNKESKFLFRGQADEKWKVETSACRRSKDKPGSKPMSEEQELYYNIKLIEQFRHGDFHSKYKSKIMEQDLGILAQLQHNGAATSLIDFSDDPLVALWFACQESPEADSNNNGKVFILSTGDGSNFEEIDSIEQIEYYKVKMPDQLQNPQVDGILNNSTFFYWKPAHLNNRITAQKSYFLIGKRELPEMEKIVIPNNSKSEILKELSSVHGINEITLYPDLVGFAQANSEDSPYDQEAQNETQKFIYKKTIFRLDKTIKDNPEDSNAYNDRGNAKYGLGRYEESIEDYNQAIKLKPEEAIYYTNRGFAKHKLGKFMEVIDDYNEGIKHDPNNARYFAGRGIAKYEEGKNKNRLEDYQGAINYLISSIDDYKEALVLSRNQSLTEAINEAIKRAEAKLKDSQDKISKDKA